MATIEAPRLPSSLTIFIRKRGRVARGMPPAPAGDLHATYTLACKPEGANLTQASGCFSATWPGKSESATISPQSGTTHLIVPVGVAAFGFPAWEFPAAGAAAAA